MSTTTSNLAAVAGDPVLEPMARCAEAFNACVTQTRLYGAFHPETGRVLDQFLAELDATSAAFGALEWTARTEGFTYRGKVFYQERPDHPGIAHHLHTEGVASLTFDPGIERDEMVQLLDILRVNLSLPQFEEETLESLLYQAELQRVHYTAVSTLMEAEALSGQRLEEEQLRAEDLLERLIERDDGADSDVARQLGDREQRQVGMAMDADRVEEDEHEWDRLFAATGEDATSIATVRETLAAERDGDALARLSGILLRATTVNSRVMSADDALRLAENAARQLYATNDAVGLLAMLDDGFVAAEAIAEVNETLRDRVRSFLQRNLHPLRVARMLRGLNPADPREAQTLRRFLRLLPEDTVLALLEGMAREQDRAALRPFLEEVRRTSGERLLQRLQGAELPPAEVALPLVFLLQATGREELVRYRGALLRHPGATVREAALSLYERDLPAADLPAVVGLLQDRSAGVRRAAVELMRLHKPREAAGAIASRLRDAGFHDLDRGVRVDLCVSYAQVAGLTAVELLEELLNVRIGLMGDERLQVSIEAAAAGLVSMGTANAVRALEKGARSWTGPRRTACQAALEGLEKKRE